MSRKLSAELLDNAERLFTEGASLTSIGQMLGANPDAISRNLRQRGVDTSARRRRPAPNRIDLGADRVAAMYQDGMSENAIAKHFDVARSCIRRHLHEAGVEVRGQSESETLKWSQMTDEQRRNQVAHAHDASRGKPKTHAERVMRAKTCQEATSECHIGIGEPEFKQFLTNIRRPFVYQKAADVYNIDFAIGSVAVELTSVTSRYAAGNAVANKRMKKLADLGYKVLAVVMDDPATLIACADDILAFVDELDGLEPVLGQYWVIRCRRQDCTIVTNELGQYTRVDVPEHFVNERRTVHYDASG